MIRAVLLVCFCTLILPIAASRAAERTTLATPIYTEVFLRAPGDARPVEVTGNLLSFDNDSLTVRTSKGDRDLRWATLTSTSAFTLRSRLIDKKVAADWLELGRFGWSIDAKDQSRSALATAVRMDASLKPQADSILATASGAALNAQQPMTTTQPNDNRELIGPAKASGKSATPHTFGYLPRPPDNTPSSPTQTYQKSTPEQNAAAIELAQKNAADIAKQFNVTFNTIETKHFLIFTDWDPREYDFLKTNLEDAYNAVSRQFEIPVTDNVFVGKLPVYMFARFSDYAKLTDSLDFLGKPTPRTLRGYYAGQSDGSGRMIMYKPGSDDVAQAEVEWAHCLVHEFTHAFVSRYRTNARIPRWLNEGIAEVIAAKSFAFPGTYPFAQRMAVEHKSAETLFDDKIMPSGDWYPVMQTMVELLVAQDHTAFKQMFDAIKDGTDGETALKKFFKIDYDQLMATWRQAVLRAH